MRPLKEKKNAELWFWCVEQSVTAATLHCHQVPVGSQGAQGKKLLGTNAAPVSWAVG